MRVGEQPVVDGGRDARVRRLESDGPSGPRARHEHGCARLELPVLVVCELGHVEHVPQPGLAGARSIPYAGLRQEEGMLASKTVCPRPEAQGWSPSEPDADVILGPQADGERRVELTAQEDRG